MHHAIGAPRVFTHSILLPYVFVKQLTNVFYMLVSQRVTGFPPSHHRIGRIGPGGALVLPFTFKEIQVEGVVVEICAFSVLWRQEFLEKRM